MRRLVMSVLTVFLLSGCTALGIRPPELQPTATIDMDATVGAPTPTEEPSGLLPAPTWECEEVPEAVAKDAVRMLGALIEGKPGKFVAVYKGPSEHYLLPSWVIATRMSTGETVMLEWSKKGQRDLLDLFSVDAGSDGKPSPNPDQAVAMQEVVRCLNR